jgi:hypothetical protein
MITRFLIATALLILTLTSAIAWMTGVKGSPGLGSPDAPSAEEKKLAENLSDTVKELSFEIGARSWNRFGSLQRASERVEEMLDSFGYKVDVQSYEMQGKRVENLVVETPGTTLPQEVVLIGTHYDSYLASPGADCNASGVAVAVELARLLRHSQVARTLRFVFFTNGESPWQGTEFMGSAHYAAAAKARGDSIELALLLDSVGYYSQNVGSQSFPFPLSSCYPKKGDFVAFFGTFTGKKVVQQLLARWPSLSTLPAEGGAVPGWFPGIHGADHLSFVDAGYPAVLVTDTAESRWPDARTSYDACSRLDYASMARLTLGLKGLVLDVAASGVQ